VPASAVILQGFTPTGGEATDTQLVATYVCGWELPNRWRVDAALRYGTSSEGEDRFNIWAPSAVLRIPVGERWGVHAEYFGLFAQDRAGDFVRHYVTPAVRFLVTPNLEVGDIRDSRKPRAIPRPRTRTVLPCERNMMRSLPC
jgi:hypothetical protein